MKWCGNSWAYFDYAQYEPLTDHSKDNVAIDKSFLGMIVNEGHPYRLLVQSTIKYAITYLPSRCFTG
jgi:hypothetical protein